MADAWMWLAHYDDGSTQPEFDDQGRDNGIASVKFDRLVAFELIPLRPGLARPVVHLNPKEGQRLIFTRSRPLEDAFGTPGGIPRPPLTYLGWKQVLKVGKNQHFTAKSISVFFEDGTIASANHDLYRDRDVF